VEIEWLRVFKNAHWTATLVKSAYLALFAVLGYRAVLDPFGEYVRQTLHAYYRDGASRGDATVYFYPFRTAVKLSLGPDMTPEAEGPDTLNDNTFPFRYTKDDGFFFAASVRFKINDVIAMVTLPMSGQVDRCEEVIRRYNRLMHGRPELAASVACGPLPLVDSLPVPFQLVDHELHDLVQVLDAEVVGVGPLPELVATGPRRRHLLDLAPQRLDLCPAHGLPAG